MNQVQGNANATRRVRMIAPTYISGKVADVGTEQKMTSAMASEFVGNGRAVYLDAKDGDVRSPPAIGLPVPDHVVSDSANSTLSLKGKSNAQ